MIHFPAAAESMACGGRRDPRTLLGSEMRWDQDGKRTNVLYNGFQTKRPRHKAEARLRRGGGGEGETRDARMSVRTTADPA